MTYHIKQQKQRKVFLHIGIRRTGSTTIARFLDTNRRKLVDKGFLYPKIGCWKGGHHLLPGYFIGSDYWLWQCQNLFLFDSNIERVFNFLKDEIEESTCKSVILSSPYFYNISSDAVQIIAELLHEYDVTIIVYLRRQDSWVESLYCDAVENPHIKFTGTPADLPILGGGAQFPCYPVELPEFLDYHRMLAPWGQVFGPENIIVREYDKLQKGVLADFLELTKLSDFFSSVNEPNLNASIPHRALNILRAGNRLELIDDDYEELKKNLNRSANKQIRGNEFLVDRNLRSKIMKECQQSNIDVAWDYLKRKKTNFCWRC
jgi:hypothetical protein